MTDISLENGRTLIRPGQDIVASMAEALRDDLVRIVEHGTVTELVMDMNGVEMLDSVGLGLLIKAHNTLSERGGGLIIQGAGRDIRKLLETMRLDKHFSIE